MTTNDKPSVLDAPPVASQQPLARLLRWLRSDLAAAASLGLLLVLAVLAIGAPWIAPFSPIEQDLVNTLADASLSANITTATLTVTAPSVTKTYDGTTVASGTATMGALAGVGAGETVGTAATLAFTNKDAGTGNKTVVFGDFSKYFVRKVGSPIIGVLRERFWPSLGIAGLIRLDGELADAAAVKHLIQA